MDKWDMMYPGDPTRAEMARESARQAEAGGNFILRLLASPIALFFLVLGMSEVIFNEHYWGFWTYCIAGGGLTTLAFMGITSPKECTIGYGIIGLYLSMLLTAYDRHPVSVIDILTIFKTVSTWLFYLAIVIIGVIGTFYFRKGKIGGVA